MFSIYVDHLVEAADLIGRGNGLRTEDGKGLEDDREEDKQIIIVYLILNCVLGSSVFVYNFCRQFRTHKDCFTIISNI